MFIFSYILLTEINICLRHDSICAFRLNNTVCQNVIYFTQSLGLDPVCSVLHTPIYWCLQQRNSMPLTQQTEIRLYIVSLKPIPLCILRYHIYCSCVVVDSILRSPLQMFNVRLIIKNIITE